MFETGWFKRFILEKGTNANICVFRRLLEKQERVDAIIASLDDEAQKEEILQTITPAEQTQLKKVKHMVDM